MGWWSEPVGSKKGGPRPAKSKGSSKGAVVATTKPGKVTRCQVCGKTPRQCTCSQVGDAIPTRRGTPKAQADRIESNGIIWCGTCNSRVNPNNGVCMNMRCPTRGGTS